MTPGISPFCRVPARLIWNISPLSAAHSICPRVPSDHRYCRYIPPQADTGLALSKLHDVISGYINKHPDAASIIAGTLPKPTSGRSCRTSISMYPVQLEDRIHWIIATLSLRMPTKLVPCRLLVNRTMPPFSSHRNINKGSFRNPRGRGKCHVPGEFSWRQRVHGCSIKLCQHANRPSHWNGNNKDIL